MYDDLKTKQIDAKANLKKTYDNLANSPNIVNMAKYIKVKIKAFIYVTSQNFLQQTMKDDLMDNEIS